MSVMVRGANNPVGIVVSNGKSSKSKANLSARYALFFAHRKSNTP
jgi:hypothetical protein